MAAYDPDDYYGRYNRQRNGRVLGKDVIWTGYGEKDPRNDYQMPYMIDYGDIAERNPLAAGLVLAFDMLARRNNARKVDRKKRASEARAKGLDPAAEEARYQQERKNRKKGITTGSSNVPNAMSAGNSQVQGANASFVQPDGSIGVGGTVPQAQDAAQQLPAADTEEQAAVSNLANDYNTIRDSSSFVQPDGSISVGESPMSTDELSQMYNSIQDGSYIPSGAEASGDAISIAADTASSGDTAAAATDAIAESGGNPYLAAANAAKKQEEERRQKETDAFAQEASKKRMEMMQSTSTANAPQTTQDLGVLQSIGYRGAEDYAARHPAARNAFRNPNSSFNEPGEEQSPSGTSSGRLSDLNPFASRTAYAAERGSQGTAPAGAVQSGQGYGQTAAQQTPPQAEPERLTDVMPPPQKTTEADWARQKAEAKYNYINSKYANNANPVSTQKSADKITDLVDQILENSTDNPTITRARIMNAVTTQMQMDGEGGTARSAFWKAYAPVVDAKIQQSIENKMQKFANLYSALTASGRQAEARSLIPTMYRLDPEATKLIVSSDLAQYKTDTSYAAQLERARLAANKASALKTSGVPQSDAEIERRRQIAKQIGLDDTQSKHYIATGKLPTNASTGSRELDRQLSAATNEITAFDRWRADVMNSGREDSEYPRWTSYQQALAIRNKVLGLDANGGAAEQANVVGDDEDDGIEENNAAAANSNSSTAREARLLSDIGYKGTEDYADRHAAEPAASGGTNAANSGGSPSASVKGEADDADKVVKQVLSKEALLNGDEGALKAFIAQSVKYYKDRRIAESVMRDDIKRRLAALGVKNDNIDTMIDTELTNRQFSSLKWSK